MKYFTNFIRIVLLVCLLKISGWAQNGPVCETYQKGSNLSTVYRDLFVVGSTVYAASFVGGLAISTDGGNSFTTRTTSNGLPTNDVRAVIAVGNTVYAATGKGLSVSTDGGNNFTTKTTANGLSSDIVYGVAAIGDKLYVGTQYGLSISTDGGNTFDPKKTFFPNGDVYDVYAMDNTLYVATTNGLYQSKDGGINFLYIHYATANAVYAVGNTIYSSVYGAGLFISTNGGISFTQKTTANGLGSNYLENVYAIGNTVYVATISVVVGGGLSISTDGGNTFTNKIIDGSPDIYGVYATNSTVYVATSKGVYFCTNSALPVHLINFLAQPLLPSRVQLSWSTASETDNAYFQIERSIDLIHLERLEKMPANETSGGKGHTYTYTDISPYIGTSYYRLWQVDLSGHSTAYPWVSVVLDEQAYGVYPNPVKGNRFTLHLDEPQTAQLSLFTATGQQLGIDLLSLQGRNVVLQASSLLEAGFYFLKVKERAQVRVHRLVVK